MPLQSADLQFLFSPPLYTFTIADRSNIVTLFFFGVVAVLGSNLAARSAGKTWSPKRSDCARQC